LIFSGESQFKAVVFTVPRWYFSINSEHYRIYITC